MTPEQVMMVQASFAELGRRAPDLAERFYERLFDADPSLRTMFSEDPAVQKSLFAAELAVVVQAISRFDAFVARARDLGARHDRYGVTYVHYEIASRALLEALGDTLGPGFTDELHDAWRLAFDLVAETMMQGAADMTALPRES